jgi:hypothetical protein
VASSTNRILTTLALLALLGLIGYVELVLDVRTPRSSLIENHAIAANTSSLIKDFDAFAAAMRKRYGANAVTTIESPPLRWVAKVDDRIIHEEPVPGTFGGVLGLFVIGSRGHYASEFPFRLDPQEVPPPHQYSPMMLRNRFKDSAAARYLDFDDADVAQGPCTVLARSDFGVAGALLRLDTATYCVIEWRGKARASILIGAVLANGDPWMRPFTQRICRSVTSLALAKLADTRSRPPAYAACILVDRPTRPGAEENLRAHVYEVGAAQTLALIEPPKPHAVATAAIAAPN